MEIEQYIPKCILPNGKNHKENQKILWDEWKQKNNLTKIYGIQLKQCLDGNLYSFWKPMLTQRFQSNNPTLRNYKIVKIRVGINEIDTRKIEKNQQNQKLILWDHKIANPLDRLIKKKRLILLKSTIKAETLLQILQIS